MDRNIQDRVRLDYSDGNLMPLNFFNGQEGMVLITAWWGIWHITSGLAVSRYFAYRTSKVGK